MGDYIGSYNFIIQRCKERKMKACVFSKWDIKRIKQALYLAIASEEDFAEAQKVGLKYKDGDIVGCVPKVNRPIYDKTNRNIEAFKKVLSKINKM